jgi:hypothetical protein
MSPELDEELCRKFPKIFRDRTKSMQESCMHWGFEHGDGWYNIIESLCLNIQHHTDWKRKHSTLTDEEFDAEHQPVAAQVKEKFGGLRFYMHNTDEWIDGAISLAESLSRRTCEVCGARGEQRGGGWIRTLCEEHSKR